MKQYLLWMLLPVFLLVTGCGQDSGGKKNKSVTIELETGVPVLVQKGDELIPITESADVEIRYIPGEDTKEVTLLSGEANIIR